jgi:hypothetical protein
MVFLSVEGQEGCTGLARARESALLRQVLGLCPSDVTQKSGILGYVEAK